MTTDADAELALWAIAQKITTIRSVRDSRNEHRDVLAAIAEACWWIAALDERLELERGSEYSDARDDDPGGNLIPGIRWARNRHTHDLIATSDGHVRPFFVQPPDRGVIYISRSYRWQPVESMDLTGESARRGATERERYRAALQGQPVLRTLESAHSWLGAATA